MVEKSDKNLNANREKRRHMRYPDLENDEFVWLRFWRVFPFSGVFTCICTMKRPGLVRLVWHLLPIKITPFLLLIAGIVLLTMGYVTEQRDRDKIKVCGKTTNDSKHRCLSQLWSKARF